MDWSPQQEAGIRKGRAWVQAVLAGTTQQRLFRVFGFAGTGKSTLTQELVGDVRGVLYCAPTGKAAQVMRTKGSAGAMTIHRALYKVSQKGTSVLEELMADLAKTLKDPDHTEGDVAKLKQLIVEEEERVKQLSFYVNPEAPANEADLIVIDEGSMVGSRIGEDLMSLGIPILVQGDPGQLPPVKDRSYFMDGEPDVFLTEIHRQARDSGILRLATDIRENRNYRVGDYGPDCRVVRKGAEGNRERVLAADQMLVHSNKNRRDANYTIRKARGREGNMPLVGDKLICLQNNHDLDIMNGSQWVCDEEGVRRGNVFVNVGVQPLDKDGPPPYTLDMHASYFGGSDPSRRDWRSAEHFDFGEAITIHKAQGSQWPRVYMLDDCERFDAQLLYTGVTRGAVDVTLVASNR